MSSEEDEDSGFMLVRLETYKTCVYGLSFLVFIFPRSGTVSQRRVRTREGSDINLWSCVQGAPITERERTSND